MRPKPGAPKATGLFCILHPMKIRFDCDWKAHNWTLIPTIVVGMGKPLSMPGGWVWICFLRGRIGITVR